MAYAPGQPTAQTHEYRLDEQQVGGGHPQAAEREARLQAAMEARAAAGWHVHTAFYGGTSEGSRLILLWERAYRSPAQAREPLEQVPEQPQEAGP